MSILEHLIENTSYTSKELIEFLDNAPRKYKVFHIPKRTHGFRTIAQPIPELKNLQRITIKYLENHLPIHDSATAYIKGKGIKQNASRHCKNKYLLKLDFENFSIQLILIFFGKCGVFILNFKFHLPKKLKLTKITKHAKRHFWLNDVCICHGLLPSHSA